MPALGDELYCVGGDLTHVERVAHDLHKLFV